jgi:hypothetical protein
MDTVEQTPESKPVDLKVTFRDLALTQDIKGPAGSIKLEVSGKKVKVTRDRTTVVDTEKKVGADLAPGLLKEFAFVGVEGTLTLDERGNVTSVAGPDDFKRFVAADAGPGLFVLETPTASLNVGESWKSTERSITSLRGIDLSGDPIEFQTTFTLKSVDTEGDARIALIAVKSELEMTDGISGKAKGGALGGKSILIPELKRKVTGTVRFDLEKGVAVATELSVELSVRIEVGSGEDKVSSTLDGDAKISLKLEE